MDMEHLKSLLATSGASLVLYDGEVHTYHGRGVADLYDLYTNEPGKLRGALVADKVIGKGAAVYIKNIVPERMKIKLVLIDAPLHGRANPARVPAQDTRIH